MGPLLLAAGLVAYNSLANRWAPFHGAAYVPMNVAAASLVLVIGTAGFDLSAREIGLTWRGACAGIAIGAAAAVVVAALVSTARGRILLRDRRLEGVHGVRAVWMVAVRIPVGTALLEEVAFRGVLLAAWSTTASGTTWSGIAWSSIAFGLWHVVPTSILARANRPDVRPAPVVAGGVILTTLAGAGLGWLRMATGGLAAPLLAHAMVNGAGAAGAILAHRRR